MNRFVHTLEHYAGLAKNIRGGYVPELDERAHGSIVQRPLGVVVGDRAVELPNHAAREQARAGAASGATPSSPSLPRRRR